MVSTLQPAPVKPLSRLPAWFSYASVGIAVATIFSVVHVLRAAPAFPYDDPYITLHSAQVMHTGYDANYPGVPALFGVTSAPFLGVVYLLLFLLPPLQALDAACWVGLLLYALGLVYLGEVLELLPRQRWLLVFIGVAAAPVPIHWINGLETSWALAMVTWTLSLATTENRRISAAFLAGVSACFRPDLLPFALLIAAMLAWQTLRQFPEQRRSWFLALGVAAAAAAPILFCCFLYFHQTGSPIPLTGVAKRYFLAEDHWPLMRRIEAEGIQILFFAVSVGPAILVIPRMARFPLGKILLYVMLLFVAALFVQFPAEFAVNEFRYPVVLIPALVWGLGMVLRNSEPQGRRSAEQRMIASALYAAAMLPLCFHFYKGERVAFEAGPGQVTSWCEKNLPAGTPVLVNDAGYLAWSSRFRTVDFVGLKTPEAIPLNRRYTWVTGGRERVIAVSRLAVEAHSSLMILNSRWPPVKFLAEDFRSLGWKVELLDAPGTFRIYRITPPT